MRPDLIQELGNKMIPLLEEKAAREFQAETSGNDANELKN